MASDYKNAEMNLFLFNISEGFDSG